MAKLRSYRLLQDLEALSTQQDQTQTRGWTSRFIHIVKKSYWCEKGVQALSIRFRGKKKKTTKPLQCIVMFSFVYRINDCVVCSLKIQLFVIVRELHSECRLYWKLIASVQSEPHHKCHVEVAGSEEAMTALSALFHLKVGKTHCDRSALHQ